MSCSVAIASSPVFSPSRIADGSPSSCGGAAAAASPFRSRFQRCPAALRAFGKESSPGGAAAEPSPSPSPPPKRGNAGALLKRKRPAMIDVPMVEALDFAPAGSDGRREVEVEGEGFSVFCKRGKRRLEMEDRHCAETAVAAAESQTAFFGIFDGHGGANAAEFAAKNLGELILQEAGREGCELTAAVRAGYLKADDEFLKERATGGTCCVTALLRDGDLVVSNAGDCRAVLSRAGAAEVLTSDHRPSREDEKERIESLGGYVDYRRGVCRLQGTLAVSRAIGDFHLKQWVVAEPETKVVRIEPDCEFLILASDGLWDKIGNQEAVDLARPLCTDPEKPSPLSACRKLVDLSASRGSVDDISAMIIQLRYFI